MTNAILLLGVLVLAYVNGANDNFKGVATLFGSGTANYRGALLFATAATLLGSVTAVFFLAQLLKSFSGRGLVEDSLVRNPQYLAAVAIGAGITVLLATRLGMPVSTTHSLIGALVGAGWAAGSPVNFDRLGLDFFAPLLGSPLVSIAATAICYPLLHNARRRLGVTEHTCLCVGQQIVEVVPAVPHMAALQRAQQLSVTLGNTVVCRSHYRGYILGVNAAAVLDCAHYRSAGVVSFARALNDTPKIAALLRVAPLFGNVESTLVVALPVAVGGVLSARRVAAVMSQRITAMNHGQGFVANFLTSAIVIGASFLGMPVSTTHVSCGALFGIGAVTRQAQLGTIARVFSAWITTLPVAALLGAIAFRMIVSI
ncbi:MAG: inorganic phosphate transporter [Armatimonadota bacterium]